MFHHACLLTWVLVDKIQALLLLADILLPGSLAPEPEFVICILSDHSVLSD